MAGALKVRVGGAWQIIPGPVGPIGPQGIQGVQGPIGNTGPQGIQGVIGPKGDKGDQGIQGIQGIQGPIGNTGLQGVQGVQGPIGLTGPGVKPGGTTGQLLIKQSNADYDTAWLTATGTGDVLGPATAVDTDVVLFNGTGGKLIKDSGVLFSNIARRDVANVFTALQTMPNLILESAGVYYYMKNTTGGVNAKNWLVQDVGGFLRFGALNDALGAWQGFMQLGRTGGLELSGALLLPAIGAVNPALKFGGTTTAFPALRNSSADAALEVISADSPASVFAPIRAASFISTTTANSLGDLTCRGATNFMAGITVSAGGGSITGTLVVNQVDINAGNLWTAGGYIYPANANAGAAKQSTWYLGSHGSYGLYTNTGLYLEGAVWPNYIEARAHIRAAGGLYDYARANPIGWVIGVNPNSYISAPHLPYAGTMCYARMGKMMFIQFLISGTVNGGAPHIGSYTCTLPEGCTMAQDGGYAYCTYDGIGWTTGNCTWGVNAGYMSFSGSNFRGFDSGQIIYIYCAVWVAVN
jgi:hypothetical protein